MNYNYGQPYQPMPTISGRFVQNAQEITPRDVPMSGTYALFPQMGMGEIYAKAWNQNGGIDTIVYRPYTEPLQPQTVNTMPNAEKSEFEALIEQQKALIAKIDELIGGMRNEHSTAITEADQVKS